MDSIITSIQRCLWRTDLCSQSFIKTIFSVHVREYNYTRKYQKNNNNSRICSSGTFEVRVRLIITCICTDLKIFVEISNGTFSRETLKSGCHNCEKIITGWHAGLLSKEFLEQYVANSHSYKEFYITWVNWIGKEKEK